MAAKEKSLYPSNQQGILEWFWGRLLNLNNKTLFTTGKFILKISHKVGQLLSIVDILVNLLGFSGSFSITLPN